MNVSTISLPSTQNPFGYPIGMAAWIGLSQCPHGFSSPSSNSNAKLVQTGYLRYYFPINDSWTPYELFYETINDNLSSSVAIRYSNSPNLQPGYNLDFSITNNGNDTVTYSAVVTNKSQVFTSKPQKYDYSTDYVQFIVESEYEYQIAEYNLQLLMR